MVYAQEPADFWEEPGRGIGVGDVFVDVPLLALEGEALADEKGDIYLATSRWEHALLLGTFPASWWFVPILTRDSFRDRDLFTSIIEKASHARLPGWFALPPLDHHAYPPLAESSVIYTLRPTIHRPEAFSDARGWRVASLTRPTYAAVCDTFMHGFREG
jgi:hypothetical protein